MGNPYGNLAGYTDPSEPGWQRRAFERVVARQKKSKRYTERADGVNPRWDPPFRWLLDEAAFRRGISAQGYVRRAIAAFVMHDLGLTAHEAAQYMPIPTHYKSGAVGGRRVRTQDNLAGYGKWIITGLEEAPDVQDGQELRPE